MIRISGLEVGIYYCPSLSVEREYELPKMRGWSSLQRELGEAIQITHNIRCPFTEKAASSSLNDYRKNSTKSHRSFPVISFLRFPKRHP
jgi:hypothetical protein